MRRFICCLALMLLMILPVLSAGAEAIDALYVWEDTLESAENELPLGAVKWHKKGAKHYLYLPAGVDASRLRVHLDGASAFTANGETVESGSVTNVFVPGTTVNIQNGSHKYTVVVMQAENIASVFLETESGGIDAIAKTKENREGGALRLTDEHGRIDYKSDFEYIRCRGNISFNAPKKSFQFKLKERFGLLGMAKAKTWLLVASYNDYTLLRNAITYEMAAAAGSVYATDFRFASVYVNAEYFGTYLLLEKVQVNEGRVDITDLEKATEQVNDQPLDSYARGGVLKYQKNTKKYFEIPNDPDDITGGYLLQLEYRSRYHEDESAFVTRAGQPVMIKSPEYASEAQVNYISALVQSFENAIRARDGIDPDTGRHYTDIADLTSIVDKYIIEEISRNNDANRSSFYVYKDSDQVDGKLYFGPVWDFGEAYASSKNGLVAAEDTGETYFWFPRLYRQADFKQAVYAAYAERYRPCLEVLLGLREPSELTGDLLSLDDYENMLSAAGEMNFSRWPVSNQQAYIQQRGKDFSAHVAQLRKYLNVRLKYLDSVWLK